MTKQSKVIISLVCVLLIIFFAGLWVSLKPQKTASILEDNGKEAFNLLAHWSQGNIVAIIRHAERCDRSDNQCLEGESGITVPGKEMSLKLGENFKTLLPINNVNIYNSPLKRTHQTAEFMFGSESVDKLWLRKDCKKNLYKDIFNRKEAGKNLILITHFTCLRELGKSDGNKLIRMNFDDKKTYGVTIFIAVNKDVKQAYVLGYLFPDNWENMQMLYAK